MKAIVGTHVHIAGFKADFDGQVACNCTILKGRVKRGPGKGRPTYRVKSYFDLESFRKEWNRTRNKAFPMAMTVTEEGEVSDVRAINKPIVERPPHSYRAVIEGIAKEGESE